MVSPTVNAAPVEDAVGLKIREDAQVRTRRLSRSPELRSAGARLAEEYIRLPDAWQWLGHVPDELPPVLAAAVSDYPSPAVPPDGDVLLITTADELLGQGLLVRHEAESARLEHIYVRAPFRQRGIATSLVEELISLARQLGYDRVLLDVMVTRTEAVRLYERLGFRSVEPYATYDVPMHFMGLDLCDLRTSGQE